MNKMKRWSVFVLFAILGCATAPTPGPVSIVTELPGPPEGMTYYQGNLYVGMAITGQVLRIDPATGRHQPYASFPAKPKATFLTGLQFGSGGELYAGVISFDPAIWGGVYRVPPGGGNAARFAGPMRFANGLALDARGNLYASSSSDGRIYRADRSGKMEVFSEAEVLKSHHKHGNFSIGVNGLAFDKSGNLYLSNTDDGTILRMAVTPDGRAGAITEVAKGLEGADGIDFDRDGNLYIAVNRQNKVVVMTPGGEIREVASGGPILFPSTPVPVDGRVYIANFNFEKRQPPFTIAVVPMR